MTQQPAARPAGCGSNAKPKSHRPHPRLLTLPALLNCIQASMLKGRQNASGMGGGSGADVGIGQSVGAELNFDARAANQSEGCRKRRCAPWRIDRASLTKRMEGRSLRCHSVLSPPRIGSEMASSRCPALTPACAPRPPSITPADRSSLQQLRDCPQRLSAPFKTVLCGLPQTSCKAGQERGQCHPRVAPVITAAVHLIIQWVHSTALLRRSRMRRAIARGAQRGAHF